MADTPTCFDVYVKAMSNTLGLIDHYYLVIDGVSYHLGFNRRIAQQHSIPSTHTLVERRLYCTKCTADFFDQLRLNEDRRLFGYYPLVNCESLSVGFSMQSLSLLTGSIISCVVLAKSMNLLLCLCVMLLTVLVCLWWGKYVRTRVRKTSCKHLNLIPTQSRKTLDAWRRNTPSTQN